MLKVFVSVLTIVMLVEVTTCLAVYSNVINSTGAMETCLQGHSYDTCYTTLNR